MRITMVARDAAPSRAFQRLARLLETRGHHVTLMVGDGKPLKEKSQQIARAVACADAALLGMSSSPELAKPEIAAGKAAQRAGVPFGFYGADGLRTWARAREGAWFAPLAQGAALYLGITQEDAEAARAVFPRARLVGTGNPLREEMAFSTFAREEVRARLGIAPEEKLVLAPGSKFGAGNMALWAMTVDALALLAAEGYRLRLVLAPHPGDRTPYAVDPVTGKPLGLYEELASYSPVPTQILSRGELTASDVVMGADLTVQCKSSVGMESAYKKVPLITVGLGVLLAKHERESGSRELEEVSSGIAEFVTADAYALADALKRLLTPEGYAPQRARQEAYCPRPKRPGQALRKMASAVEALGLK